MIQGSFRPESLHVVQNYVNSGIFDKVVYSGRTDQAEGVRTQLAYLRDVVKVFSDPPANCGVGNRNIQITSTNAGLSQVETPFVWKVRSDQILPVSTLHKIYEFVTNLENDKYHIPPSLIDMDGPVFVMGNYTRFPFHPRDHMFIGRTSDVKDVFDIPLDYISQSTDYSKWLRAEAWIGANFLAKKGVRVRHFLENFQEYLVDNAPQIGYAREISEMITPKVFRALPRIEFSWPKHGLERYHYHVGESLSEYWHE